MNTEIERIKVLRESSWTLRRIAAQYPGITYGDIARLIKGHEPTSPTKRVALGLKVYLPAPACPKCGQVHVTKRCQAQAVQKHGDLFSLPVQVLRWKLENREEVEHGTE